MSRSILTALLLVGALAGCGGSEPAAREPDRPSASSTPDEPEDSASATPTEEPEQVSCFVGHWVLDVRDYGRQSAAYLNGLGVPLDHMRARGQGSLDVGEDGFIDGVMDLRFTGRLVPSGHAPVPFSTPSSYTFSGKWNETENGRIRLTEWAAVRQAAAPPGSSPDIPPLEFSRARAVRVQCSATRLTLQGAGAPLRATFSRGRSVSRRGPRLAGVLQ